LRPNPLQDVVAFLSAPSVATGVFWLLLLASCVVAAATWRADPGQRTGRHVGIWVLRLLVGGMWWQQSLWKVPPNYDGLIHWMKQMVSTPRSRCKGNWSKTTWFRTSACSGHWFTGSRR